MPAEVVPPATSPEKPKRAKKSAPRKPRAPRTTPARTLRVRIAEIGVHHLAAFDMLHKKDSFWWDNVHAALDARDAANDAKAAVERAEAALDEAAAAMEAANKRCLETADILTRLDAKAALVAKLHDDVPEADDIDAGPTT